MNLKDLQDMVSVPIPPRHLSDDVVEGNTALPVSIKIGFALGGLRESIKYGLGSIPIIQGGVRTAMNIHYGVELGAYERRREHIIKEEAELDRRTSVAEETEVTRVPNGFTPSNA